MIFSRLKCRKHNRHGVGPEELGTHCKAALEPFVGTQNMVEL